MDEDKGLMDREMYSRTTPAGLAYHGMHDTIAYEHDE